MNRRQRLILASTCLALWGLAQAQPTPETCPAAGPGPGPRTAGWMRPPPGPMPEQHLAHLKAELKITAAQEAAWNSFAAQVTEQAKAAQAQREAQAQADAAPATAPERLARHGAQLRRQAADVEAAAATLKALYEQLSPEQRQQLDEHGPGARHAPPPHG